MTEYFALSNEYGQIYELNDRKTGVMYDVGNVGFQIERNYMRLGDKWLSTPGVNAQEEITGTVLFLDEPYEGKRQFLSFVRAAESLTLHQISPGGTYLIDVDLNHLERSALSDDSRRLTVHFSPRSLWYTQTQLIFSLNMSTTEHKEYTYQYDYLYNQFSSGVVEVENDGSVAAAFQVDFFGPITDPVIELYQGGERVASCVIQCDAKNGEHILYSSDDANLYCYLSGQSEVNLVSGFDINNANFFKLPVGDSQLKITADSAITQPINISVFKYYRTV